MRFSSCTISLLFIYLGCISIVNSQATHIEKLNLRSTASTKQCSLAKHVNNFTIFTYCVNGADGADPSRILVYSQTSGTFQTYDFPEVFDELDVAVVQDVALFVGANRWYVFNTSDPSPSLMEYDTWGITRTLGRSDFTIVSVGPYVIFFGASYGGSPHAEIDIYDSRNNTWSTRTMAVPRLNVLTAVVKNQRAYFIGGTNAANTPVNNVDVFDAVSGTWTTSALLTNRAKPYSQVGILDDSIVVAGGTDTSRIDYLNKNGVWSRVTLPNSMFSLIGQLSERVLIVVSYSDNLLHMYSNYTFTTFTLDEVINMKIGILPEVTSLTDHIVVTNGTHASVWDYAKDTWTVMEFSEPREGMIIVQTGHYIVFGGGSNFIGNSAAVDIYNTITHSWDYTRFSLNYLLLEGFADRSRHQVIFVGEAPVNFYSERFTICDEAENSTWICNDQQFCTFDLCYHSVCDFSLDNCMMNEPCNTYCNETAESCFNPANEEVDDGEFCNGDDYCDGKGHRLHTGNPCEDLICLECSEEAEECVASPINTSCDDDEFCNGNDYCDGNGACVSEGNPCLNGTTCNSQCNSDEENCHAEQGESCFNDIEGEDGYCNEGFCDINVTPEDLGLTSRKKDNSRTVVGGAVGGSAGGLLLLLGVIIFLIWKLRKTKKSAVFLDPENGVALDTIDVQLTNIQVGEHLGGGNFGDVYKGIWDGVTPVALKALKDQSSFVAFAKEAAMLKSLRHPNIVQFLGLFIDKSTDNDQKYMVTEYMSEGGLNTYIFKHASDLTIQDLLVMARQAAAGMSFLEQRNIVHRDLALRNLLLTLKTPEEGKFLVKIGDFGMSRMAQDGVYSTSDKTLPVKWSAPESIEFGTFSSKSDVWSFGIVLWELFSFAKTPYPGFSNQETIEKVKSGYRPAFPENCPEVVYELMLSCWNADPEQRPSFQAISLRVTSICKEYEMETNQGKSKKVAAYGNNNNNLSHEEPYNNDGSEAVYSNNGSNTNNVTEDNNNSNVFYNQ